MEIVNNIESYEPKENTSIALGTFDGVHLAHRQVIMNAVNSEYKSAVFTFAQSPSGIINGEAVAMLTTKTVKEQIMEGLGVELFICPDFLNIKDMLPNEFILMLKEKFNAKEIICGFNFKFGKNGAGNANILKQLCKENDITLTVVPPIMIGDEPVSSTRIRTLIENGEIPAANDLLGYAFSFEFPVIEGNHLGSTWNIPTINQKFPVTFIVPKKGVYASKVKIDGKTYKSISNIGLKPTVGSDGVSAETFVFDYEGDLYGKRILVSVYNFIREERKFEDVNELQMAINKDINFVKTLDY